MFSLVETGVKVLPESKVVKRAEYAVLVEAQEIIDKAKREAEAITRRARTELEAERQRGYHEGREQAAAEMAEKIMGTVNEGAAYLQKIEALLVEVVDQALRRVLGEIDQHEVIARVVNRALESVRKKSDVTIRVSPSQAEYLQQRLKEMVSQSPHAGSLQVQPDNRLNNDACVLETDVGIVDASIQTQLKAIENALIKALE